MVIIKNYSILLFLSSFILCENPYVFLDAKKQLEFEKKRIYIKDVEEKEMMLSGGGLGVDPALALFTAALVGEIYYTNKNIKTDYVYKYIFEIKQNNVLLDEQSFLKIVGLDDEAANILEPQLKSYFSKTLTTNGYNGPLDLNHYEIISKKMNWLGLSKNIIGIALTGCGAYLYETSWVHPQNLTWDERIKRRNLKENSGKFMMTLGIPLFSWSLLTQLSKGFVDLNILTYRRVTLKDFIYKQALSSEQIAALANSYNQKIYNEIKNQ